ncbi:MAG: HD domain-containing protein [Ginsengibacter sp.]
MQNDVAMKEFVVKFLKDNLPLFYFYHNEQHTLYVLKKAVEIAEHEKCTSQEIRLIKAAALWHDTGITEAYVGHEEISCRLAAKNLPDFGFSIDDINTIKGMIMATKIPQSPHNKLEEIIADADLEYLGTERASEISSLLFRELQYLDGSLTKDEWINKQIPFLRNHHYFTKYLKGNQEHEKNRYLKFLTDHV